MLEVSGSAGGLDGHNFGGKTDWLTVNKVPGLSAAAIGQRTADNELVLARHIAEIIVDFDIDVLLGALETVAHMRALVLQAGAHRRWLPDFFAIGQAIQTMFGDRDS